MCKAQNNFQLLLVKLFNQTYYCSDTKFWPDICLLCHTSVNPCPSPIYLSGIFPPLLFFCCLLFVPLCSTICSTILFHYFVPFVPRMFWSSNIQLSFYLGSSESCKFLKMTLLANFFVQIYPLS